MFYILRKISILNTIKFNLKYFAPKVGIRIPVIVGKNVARMSLHGSVYLDVPENQITLGMIKIGFSNLGIVDYKKEQLLFENSGELHFAGKADIGTGSRISNAGTLRFGENFQSSGKMTIICKRKISFGKDNLISWNTLFMDSDLHNITDVSGKGNLDKPIEIGDHVWVGCNVTILKGVKIASNTVVAAGSVIAGKETSNNCIVGNDGIVLKSAINWRH